MEKTKETNNDPVAIFLLATVKLGIYFYGWFF